MRAKFLYILDFISVDIEKQHTKKQKHATKEYKKTRESHKSLKYMYQFSVF